MKKDQLFFIWDGESVGLHGKGYAVAGGIYDLKGAAVREFAYHTDLRKEDGRLQARGEEDEVWCRHHVKIPPESIYKPHGPLVIQALWGEWSRAREEHPGILMMVECGWPVEARLLCRMIDQSPAERWWDGPYPLHEIATVMLCAGLDPMDKWERLPNELPEHNPQGDARLSARINAAAFAKIRGEWNTVPQ